MTISIYHFQAGEHSMWNKYTAFEIAHRAPMMIHVPGLIDQVNYEKRSLINMHLTNFQSMFSENLVEFVDILPTLVAAAGLPELKKCPVDSRDIAICREGTSLLRIPEGIRDGNVAWPCKSSWSH